MQQQQQQPHSSPPPPSRRRAHRQNHQSPQSRKNSLTRASAERGRGDHNDDIDSGELSPQSRRRHQSRQSSARLRERQRQRIHNAEDEVSKLENYVRSLQQTIDMHRHQTTISGGPDILGTMGIMHPNTAQQVQPSCSSDEESRRNFDARVRQLILSLSEAMHQLGGCVERIDVLKQLLVGRIGLTEQALLEEMQQLRSSSSDSMSISPPPYSMTESNMRKHTSGNSPSNSGNNSGSNSGSSSNTLGGNSYATAGPPSKVAKTDTSSRIPISFLVDEEQADSSGGAA
ncbi:hypothetical protein GGI15_003721 [Coemansia interrupta]|uniref:BZIP domain-containing protein n=1 Tax=Coemansia interrupta TaxID=1126814 RepID=A0A9W8LH85_9FUNG|nr:hypothetical protein GGI15_003721 [Coemansia interrupta]